MAFGSCHHTVLMEVNSVLEVRSRFICIVYFNTLSHIVMKTLCCVREMQAFN